MMKQRLTIIGLTILVFVLGSLVLALWKKTIAQSQYRQGYNKQAVLHELTSLGVPEHLGRSLIHALQKCATTDFPVQLEDRIRTIYGLGEPDDIKDFIFEEARQLGYDLPESLEIPYERLTTVKELILFIANVCK